LCGPCVTVHTVTPQRGPMFGGTLVTIGGAGLGAGLGGAAPLWQGLTLVPFSPQPEPFLVT